MVTFRSIPLVVLTLAAALCRAQNYTITTVAGGGNTTDQGNTIGDGGPATKAYMLPTGVAVDSAGNLYIADAVNQVIRKVTPDGLIATIVGVVGSNGYAGDGGPATSALLASPQCVAVDSAGNLYISDTGNARIRKVTTDGIITTMAGGGSSFGLGFGDGGPATSAVLAWPAGLAVDSGGALYIADRDANNVRKVTPDGAITTVAGCSVCFALGDGGPATKATDALCSCRG